MSPGLPTSHRTNATWRSWGPRPFFEQSSTLCRTFPSTQVIASSPRMPPFRTGRQPHRRAGLRRSHRGPRAGDSACHRSRKCRDGQRAGVGRARRRSRKHRPAGWEGLRLPRWSGTWRWPWGGRRGGGDECWESPTGVALTQEPVAECPRQVCPPFTLLSSSPALGS